jgi:Cof subfamily protein (haloacid dehalogenase superfamily)
LVSKLVFLDIDGTVVSHKTNPSHIPEPTREAVRLLFRAGHAVAFATGRSRATTKKPMEELGIADAVFCNGSHIILDGATVYIRNIDRSITDRAARHVAKAKYTGYAADEKFIYICNVSAESLDYLREQTGGGVYIKEFTEMRDVCKLEYYGDTLIKGFVTKKADIRTDHGCIQYRPPGICKEQGIRRFVELKGFSIYDTVVVGDGENDIGMLKEAAIGIAVGGAPDAVKAAADVVADDIEDGGIFNVFRQLGLI